MPDDHLFEIEDTYGNIRRWVEQRLAQLQPKHGRHGRHGRDGKNGRDGIDGQVDLMFVRERVAEECKKIPPPLNGRDGVDGKNGRDGIDGVKGEDGKDGKHGKNGINGARGPKGDKGEKGDKGDRGEQGVPGPIPDHRWDGTKLQFELPSGKWGDAVDLRGPRGRDGASGGGGGFASSDVVVLNPALHDHAASGFIIAIEYGGALTRGAPVYVAADGTAQLADANGTATFPCTGLALADAASGTHQVLLQGNYRDDSFNWTVGGNAGLIYLSTSGTLTQVQPSATDDVIQIVGFALSATNMYFNPNLGFVTHT